jgi:hypothetical protein
VGHVEPAFTLKRGGKALPRFGVPDLVAGNTMLAAPVIVAVPALSADDAATLDSWQSSFQQVWLSDSCVQEFQSWNKYWQGVHDFYFGARGSDGWFAESTAILAHVTDADAHTAVYAQLTTLGRRVGGELAKVDGCRKIRSGNSFMQRIADPDQPALTSWSKQLKAAANADSGNGRSVEAAIKSINSQLDALGVSTP